MYTYYKDHQNSSNEEEPPMKKPKTASVFHDEFVNNLTIALTTDAERVDADDVHKCAVMATINVFLGN